MTQLEPIDFMQEAEQLLKKYYGYRSFKPIQQKAIESIMRGQDTFVVMPTGGGKSLCYQIPALMLDGMTLVISPLISLMKDQVDQLLRIGISAACMNSMLDESQYQKLREQILRHEIKILYVAPERLRSGDFLSVLRKQKIALVAVDEAHCVSQWGHDFRPSYHGISQFIRLLPKRPVVAAFTATATAETRTDIIQRLELVRPNIYRASFNRSNLILSVQRDGNRKEALLEFVRNHPHQAGIIYCNTRKEVDKIWDYLRRAGIQAVRYHGGMEDWERNENQDRFLQEKVNLIVATNAFGMGINKPDVRYVVHYNLPKNIESYYQEIGRAGRDGLPSLCVLFFSYSDVHINRYLLEQNSKSEERLAFEMGKLEDMVQYASTRKCLRQHILQYFGETAKEQCNGCSNCCEVSLGKPVLAEADAALLKELRTMRLMLAMDEGVPSYRIMSDEVLEQLAEKQPVSLVALEQIHGLGEQRMLRYGNKIIETITNYQKAEG